MKCQATDSIEGIPVITNKYLIRYVLYSLDQPLLKTPSLFHGKEVVGAEVRFHKVLMSQKYSNLKFTPVFDSFRWTIEMDWVFKCSNLRIFNNRNKKTSDEFRSIRSFLDCLVTENSLN